MCKKFIDIRIKGEGCIDHNHVTGEIRGVLHRSCNAGLGKVEHAAAQWGAKTTDPAAILVWLRAMLEYHDQPGVGMIYPMHKTDEEKKDVRNLKARQVRAANKAKVAVALAARAAKKG